MEQSFQLMLASASDVIGQSAQNACGTSCNTNLSVTAILANIANVLVFIVGSVSVIMIIIGGLRYVLSQGDTGAVSKAKNTILYSVVGVVVAVIAYAIIQFVTDILSKTG
ncbi:hypothetical protein IPG36_01945 [bacterium]|nr:MAG: hypothetical protein IPG36_01945 [bacterium]